jgi:hypothetical protein
VVCRITGLHLWSPGRRQPLGEFCTYLLGFITPELPALLAATPSAEAAARIAEDHARFAGWPGSRRPP